MTYDATSTQIALIVVLVVWELAWKGFALWRAARRDQRNWFIALLVISGAGILPMIYLLTTGYHDRSPEKTYLKNPTANRTQL